MPGPKEESVESYLIRRVKETGGQVRKQVWPGHNGSPDRFCYWPNGRHGWPELKRPIGGKLEGHQSREIEKMRKAGLNAPVLTNRLAVDIWIDQMTL